MATSIANETMFSIAMSADMTDSRSVLLKMSSHWKILLWLTIMSSLMLGWLSKRLIYTHIFKTKIQEQPINVLILIKQVIHHFCGNLVLVNYSATLLFGLSSSELIEPFFDSHIYCHVLGCIQVFGGIYFAGDGICIAIVRLLYVKRGSWVRYTCGEFCLVNMVAGISILNAALMTYLHSHENISNRSVYNVCMGFKNFNRTEHG